MNKKGMERGLEIVIALVIVLIIAVSIIFIFNKNFRQADQSNEGTLNESASGISYNLCKIKCDACVAQKGGCTNWANFQAKTGDKNKCDSEGIYTPCPPVGSSATPSTVEEAGDTTTEP
jgi:hypothetical protein